MTDADRRTLLLQALRRLTDEIGRAHV